MPERVIFDDELRDARGRVINTDRDMYDPETGNYIVTKMAGGAIGPRLAELCDPTKEWVVSVVWTTIEWKRRGFHTHVCVQGPLQRHPDEATKYRVLVNQAIYAYFDEANVTAIAGRPNIPFQDGSRAVIYIE